VVNAESKAKDAFHSLMQNLNENMPELLGQGGQELLTQFAGLDQTFSKDGNFMSILETLFTGSSSDVKSIKSLLKVLLSAAFPGVDFNGVVNHGVEFFRATAKAVSAYLEMKGKTFGDLMKDFADVVPKDWDKSEL